MPKDLPSCLQSSFTWCFKVKRLSKIIPRYFILGDSKIVTPFKRSVTLSFRLARGGLKIKNSVLLAFRERRLEQSHSKSSFLKINSHNLGQIFGTLVDTNKNIIYQKFYVFYP